MSEGVSHRQVWALVVPIILSNLTVPLMGAVQTGVMGHLPDPAYIGGVALGTQFFSYFYLVFGFLRMATTGFVAQAKGAGDAQELRSIAVRGTILALGFGALLIALQAPLADLTFLALGGSAKVQALGHDYIALRIWSAPAALFGFVALGWLIGMAHMRTVLVLTFVQNGLNALLAIWFVNGLGWGIAGVAVATLIAECAGAVVAAIAVWHAHRGKPGRWLAPGLLDRHRLLGMMQVNGNIFLRTLFLLTGLAWFTSQGARQGDIVLAANAVLINLLFIASYGLDAFANAAETLVGGAIGARRRAALSAAVRVTTLWAGGIALAATGAFALLGPALIDLLTGLDAVRSEARRYLPWAIVSPIVAVWCFQFDGIYIGATRTAEMRNGMALALLLLLGLGYALMPALGNHGLWLALLAFFAFRGLALWLWYPRIVRSVPA
jgi:MATE family multidrug resistance protein